MNYTEQERQIGKVIWSVTIEEMAKEEGADEEIQEAVTLADQFWAELVQDEGDALFYAVARRVIDAVRFSDAQTARDVIKDIDGTLRYSLEEIDKRIETIRAIQAEMAERNHEPSSV